MAYIEPLPFQEKLSYSSSYSVEPIVRTLNFGDGYTQRTPLGARPTRATATVVYENISKNQATDILNFLEATWINGYIVSIDYSDLFYGTYTYDVESWDVSAHDPNRQSITVNLVQVWDL